MKQINKTGHLAIFTANVIFGLNLIVSKTLMPVYISPMALTFFRMTGACVLFFLASFVIPSEKIAKRDYLMLFLASLFGLLINQMSFLKGLSYTSPIDASLILTSLPILAMLISAAYLKEPITRLKVFGVLVGASGAVIIIYNSHSVSTFAGENHFLGNLLCFVSCLSYAMYLVFFKALMGKYHPVTIMKWMFLYASILAIPFCYKDVISIDYAALPDHVYWRILYVVCGASFLAYLLIPIGVRELRPTTVSMYNYLQPLIASLIAVMMGIDTFGFWKTLAAVLIFLGVFLVTQSKSRADLEA